MQCTLCCLGFTCYTFNAPLQSGGRYWKICSLSTFALAPRFCWVSFSPQRHIIKILFFKFFHIKSRFFKRINDYPGSFLPNKFYSSISFFLLRCVRGEGKGQVPSVCYSRSPGKQTQKYTMHKSLFYSTLLQSTLPRIQAAWAPQFLSGLFTQT